MHLGAVQLEANDKGISFRDLYIGIKDPWTKRSQLMALARADKSGGDQAHVVDTLGGRVHVRWDEGAAATPHGQLVYFAEFLAATGVFER